MNKILNTRLGDLTYLWLVILLTVVVVLVASCGGSVPGEDDTTTNTNRTHWTRDCDGTTAVYTSNRSDITAVANSSQCGGDN